jgi:hypothetical protein
MYKLISMDKKYKDLQLKLKRVEHELEESKLINEELTMKMKDLKRTYRYNTMTLLNECNQILTKQAFELTNGLAYKFIKHVNSNDATKYKPEKNDDSDDSDDSDDESSLYRYGQFDIVKKFLKECEREEDNDEDDDQTSS